MENAVYVLGEESKADLIKVLKSKIKSINQKSETEQEYASMLGRLESLKIELERLNAVSYKNDLDRLQEQHRLGLIAIGICPLCKQEIKNESHQHNIGRSTLLRQKTNL